MASSSFGAFEGGCEKAPSAICRKVIEVERQSSSRIEVWGDGSQVRSYLYIEDCIEATVRLMRNDVRDPVNIGSGRPVSVDQLINIVEGIAGTKAERLYLPKMPTAVPARRSDNTKVKAELGWKPRISLEAGLERLYAWMSSRTDFSYSREHDVG